MAETDLHRDNIFGVLYPLQSYFRDRKDVYVSGNLFVYYGEELRLYDPAMKQFLPTRDELIRQFTGRS